MPLTSLSRSPQGAAAAVALGGASLLLLARPAGGQQAPPVVHVSAPAAAVGRAMTTRVSLDYTLSAGVHLQRLPRVRAVRDTGLDIELHPIYPTRGEPSGAGYADLLTALYPPGTYHVTAEILYTAPDGQVITLSSPAATLVVPAH
jgi:hypothetical protein